MELHEVVSRLKEIKEERLRLNDEEQTLSSPAITDPDRIPEVLEYCKESYRELHPNSKVRVSEVRRMYIFILLFLFSPKTLAGGKMSNGLRTRIAGAMGIESSNVSHYHADVWFYYTVYSDFRDDVNGMFALVFDKLKKENQ